MQFLSSAASLVINRLLGDYVANVDTRNVSISLGGEVKLEKLQLKSTALDKMGLPIKVRAGVISKLHLQVPLRSSTPAIIAIEDLYILACPKSRSSDDYNEIETLEKEQRDKQRKLALAESYKQARAQTTAKDEASDDGFVQRLLKSVLSTLQVSIKRFHFRFEDPGLGTLDQQQSFSSLFHSPPFSFGFHLDSLEGKSTDSQWNESQTSTSILEILLYKLVSLSSLSLYLDLNDKSVLDECGVTGDGNPEFSMFSTVMKGSIPSRCDKKEHHYIVDPTGGVLQIVLNKKSNNLEFPKLSVKLNLQQVLISLRPEQYHSIMYLLLRLDSQAASSKYLKWKPKESPTTSPRLWWSWAIRSVLQPIQARNYLFTPEYFTLRRQRREQYVPIFVKQINKLPVTAAELSTLVSLEKLLSFEEIMFFRALAEIEAKKSLHLEKSAPSPSAPSQGWGNWLGSFVWGSSTTNTPPKEEEVPTETETPTRNADSIWDSIKLNEAEKDALLEAVHFDRGEDYQKSILPPQYEKYQFSWKTPLGALVLIDSQSTPLVSFGYSNFSVESRIKAQETAVEVQIDDLKLSEGKASLARPSLFTDLLYPHSPSKNALLSFKLLYRSPELKESLKKDDIDISLFLRRLDLVINLEMAKTVTKAFWKPLKAISALSGPVKEEKKEIENSTFQRTKSWAKSEKRNAQVLALAGMRKSVHLEVEIEAPNVLIPLDCSKEDSPMLALALGTFTFVTMQKEGEEEERKEMDPSMTYLPPMAFQREYFTTHQLKISDIHAVLTTVDRYRTSKDMNEFLQEEQLLDPLTSSILFHPCKIHSRSLPQLIVNSSISPIRLHLNQNQLESLVLISKYVGSTLALLNPSNSPDEGNAVVEKSNLKVDDLAAQSGTNLLLKDSEDSADEVIPIFDLNPISTTSWSSALRYTEWLVDASLQPPEDQTSSPSLKDISSSQGASSSSQSDVNQNPSSIPFNGTNTEEPPLDLGVFFQTFVPEFRISIFLSNTQQGSTIGKGAMIETEKGNTSASSITSASSFHLSLQGIGYLLETFPYALRTKATLGALELTAKPMFSEIPYYLVSSRSIEGPIDEMIARNEDALISLEFMHRKRMDPRYQKIDSDGNLVFQSLTTNLHSPLIRRFMEFVKDVSERHLKSAETDPSTELSDSSQPRSQLQSSKDPERVEFRLTMHCTAVQINFFDLDLLPLSNCALRDADSVFTIFPERGVQLVATIGEISILDATTGLDMISAKIRSALPQTEYLDHLAQVPISMEFTTVQPSEEVLRTKFPIQNVPLISTLKLEVSSILLHLNAKWLFNMLLSSKELGEAFSSPEKGGEKPSKQTSSSAYEDQLQTKHAPLPTDNQLISDNSAKSFLWYQVEVQKTKIVLPEDTSLTCLVFAEIGSINVCSLLESEADRSREAKEAIEIRVGKMSLSVGNDGIAGRDRRYLVPEMSFNIFMRSMSGESQFDEIIASISKMEVFLSPNEVKVLSGAVQNNVFYMPTPKEVERRVRQATKEEKRALKLNPSLYDLTAFKRSEGKPKGRYIVKIDRISLDIAENGSNNAIEAIFGVILDLTEAVVVLQSDDAMMVTFKAQSMSAKDMRAVEKMPKDHPLAGGIEMGKEQLRLIVFPTSSMTPQLIGSFSTIPQKNQSSLTVTLNAFQMLPEATILNAITSLQGPIINSFMSILAQYQSIATLTMGPIQKQYVLKLKEHPETCFKFDLCLSRPDIILAASTSSFSSKKHHSSNQVSSDRPISRPFQAHSTGLKFISTSPSSISINYSQTPSNTMANISVKELAVSYGATMENDRQKLFEISASMSDALPMASESSSITIGKQWKGESLGRDDVSGRENPPILPLSDSYSSIGLSVLFYYNIMSPMTVDMTALMTEKEHQFALQFLTPLRICASYMDYQDIMDLVGPFMQGKDGESGAEESFEGQLSDQQNQSDDDGSMEEKVAAGSSKRKGGPGRQFDPSTSFPPIVPYEPADPSKLSSASDEIISSLINASDGGLMSGSVFGSKSSKSSPQTAKSSEKSEKSEKSSEDEESSVPLVEDLYQRIMKNVLNPEDFHGTQGGNAPSGSGIAATVTIPTVKEANSSEVEVGGSILKSGSLSAASSASTEGRKRGRTSTRATPPSIMEPSKGSNSSNIESSSPIPTSIPTTIPYIPKRLNVASLSFELMVMDNLQCDLGLIRLHIDISTLLLHNWDVFQFEYEALKSTASTENPNIQFSSFSSPLPQRIADIDIHMQSDSFTPYLSVWEPLINPCTFQIRLHGKQLNLISQYPIDFFFTESLISTFQRIVGSGNAAQRMIDYQLAASGAQLKTNFSGSSGLSSSSIGASSSSINSSISSPMRGRNTQSSRSIRSGNHLNYIRNDTGLPIRYYLVHRKVKEGDKGSSKEVLTSSERVLDPGTEEPLIAPLEWLHASHHTSTASSLAMSKIDRAEIASRGVVFSLTVIFANTPIPNIPIDSIGCKVSHIDDRRLLVVDIQYKQGVKVVSLKSRISIHNNTHLPLVIGMELSSLSNRNSDALRASVGPGWVPERSSRSSIMVESNISGNQQNLGNFGSPNRNSGETLSSGTGVVTQARIDDQRVATVSQLCEVEPFGWYHVPIDLIHDGILRFRPGLKKNLSSGGGLGLDTVSPSSSDHLSSISVSSESYVYEWSDYRCELKNLIPFAPRFSTSMPVMSNSNGVSDMGMEMMNHFQYVVGVCREATKSSIIAKSDELILHFQPPLVIENLLPFDCEYLIHEQDPLKPSNKSKSSPKSNRGASSSNSKSQSLGSSAMQSTNQSLPTIGTIKSGQRVAYHQISSSSRPIYLAISSDGFDWSSEAMIRGIEPIGPRVIAPEMLVSENEKMGLSDHLILPEAKPTTKDSKVDTFMRLARVTLENQVTEYGTRLLSFYTPYWVVNKTGIPILAASDLKNPSAIGAGMQSRWKDQTQKDTMQIFTELNSSFASTSGAPLNPFQAFSPKPSPSAAPQKTIRARVSLSSFFDPVYSSGCLSLPSYQHTTSSSSVDPPIAKLASAESLIRAKTEKLHLPMIYAPHAEQATKKLYIKVQGSKWSVPLNLETAANGISRITVTGETTSDAYYRKIYDLSLSVDTAAERFWRTTVMTLAPRYMLTNKLSVPLLIRAFGFSHEGIIQPGETVPWHWIWRANGETLTSEAVQISLILPLSSDAAAATPIGEKQGNLESECGWSGEMLLESGEMKTVAMLNPRTKSRYFVRVMPRLHADTGITTIIFKQEDFSTPLFKIINKTTQSISIRQAGLKNDHPCANDAVPAFESRIWGWYSPMVMDKGVEIYFGKNRVPKAYSMTKVREYPRIVVKGADEAEFEIAVSVRAERTTRVLTIEPSSIRRATTIISKSSTTSNLGGTGSISASLPSQSTPSSSTSAISSISSSPWNIGISLRAITLSVVSNVPEEIIFGALSRIAFEMSIYENRWTYELQIEDIQVDNSDPMTFYPVTICSGPGSSPTYWLHFSLVRSTEFSDIICQPLVSLLVKETHVRLDEVILMKILDLYNSRKMTDIAIQKQGISAPSSPQFDQDPEISKRKNPASSSSSSSQSSHPSSNSKLAHLVTNSEDILTLGFNEDASKMIYTEFANLNPIHILLSFSFTKGSTDEDREREMIERDLLRSAAYRPWTIEGIGLQRDFPALYGYLTKRVTGALTFERAPIFISCLHVEHSFVSYNVLFETVMAHYYDQVVKFGFSVVGSLEVLGDPIALGYNIGSGVKDLFYEPAKGIAISPKAFGEGLGRGGAKFAKKSIYGIFNTLNKTFNAVGTLASHASFDGEYQAKRAQRKQREQPKNVVHGIGQGFFELGKGLFDGITGVITKPVQGAQKEGAEGFFKGVGKGLAGVVVKPVVGVFDFAQRTTEGIKNTAIDSIRKNRIRWPLFISLDGVLKPYNPSLSLAMHILHSVKSERWSHEEFWGYFQCISQKQVTSQNQKSNQATSSSSAAPIASSSNSGAPSSSTSSLKSEEPSPLQSFSTFASSASSIGTGGRGAIVDGGNSSNASTSNSSLHIRAQSKTVHHHSATRHHSSDAVADMGDNPMLLGSVLIASNHRLLIVVNTPPQAGSAGTSASPIPVAIAPTSEVKWHVPWASIIHTECSFQDPNSGLYHITRIEGNRKVSFGIYGSRERLRDLDEWIQSLRLKHRTLSSFFLQSLNNVNPHPTYN